MELALQETFLMERYWPGVSRADLVTTEEHLCRAAGELTRDGSPIRILSSTWIPADEVVLTLFDAGEEDDVLEVGRRSNYPFDRMQRVEVFTGASQRWRTDEDHVWDRRNRQGGDLGTA